MGPGAERVSTGRKILHDFQDRCDILSIRMVGITSSTFCSARMPALLLFCLAAALGPVRSLAQEPSSEPLAPPPPSLWKAGVGEGLNAGTHDLEFFAGGGYGVHAMGSRSDHVWALGAARYGWVFTDTVAPNGPCRCNWELAGELFAGHQFHPDSGYVVGLTPHVRYLFSTGTPWVPFVDLGAGVTATDIRDGDLSTTFEFNLNAGVGTLYFLRDNLALSLEARLIHLSNAGMDTPNNGLNSVNLFLGLASFF